MLKRILPAQYQIYDFFELLLGFISLTASLISIYEGIINHDYNFLIIVTGLLGFAIIVAIKTSKLRTINTKRFEVFSCNYYAVSELIKNGLYLIKDQVQKGILHEALLWEQATGISQKVVDALSEILSTSSGYKVCVCIKYFVTDKDGKNPKSERRSEDYQLKTLCRSQNTDRNRLTDELSQVGVNTDFLQIMKDDKSFFYSRDLKKTDEQYRDLKLGSYENSTPLWSEYYNSTIVAPIRIKRSIYPYDPSNERYLILGFLCADSLSTSAFPNQHADIYASLIIAFADVLFPYLDSVFYYLGEIN